MQRRRRSPAKWAKEQLLGIRISRGFVGAAVVAAPIALFSFVAAAANGGIAIPFFRAAGPSLYPDFDNLDKRDAAIVGKKISSAKARAHVAESRALLVFAPLSSAVVRSIALGRDALGDEQGAARSMAIASRLSRRDGLTQMWLANAALRKEDAQEGFRHFDTFLRTYSPAETQVAIEQMVGALRFREARVELAPYVSGSNPWYERFIGVAAGRAPKAADVADLLLRAKSIPDNPYLRGYYATLFERLINEKAYAEALRLYPRLPGAKPGVLRAVAATPETLSVGYAPAIWSFADDVDRGGAPRETNNGVGLEFYAQADTIGVSGQKLIKFPAAGKPQTLYWTVAEQETNSGSSARWKLNCLGPKQPTEIQSINLMTVKPGSRLRMAVPAGCAVAVLRMEMAGGVGNNMARIFVNRLRTGTDGASPAEASTAR